MASNLRTQPSEADAQKELVLVLLATRIEAGRKTGFFYWGLPLLLAPVLWTTVERW